MSLILDDVLSAGDAEWTFSRSGPLETRPNPAVCSEQSSFIGAHAGSFYRTKLRAGMAILQLENGRCPCMSWLPRPRRFPAHFLSCIATSTLRNLDFVWFNAKRWMRNFPPPPPSPRVTRPFFSSLPCWTGPQPPRHRFLSPITVFSIPVL